ncbi:AGE family epimerase/isomerase [Streptomyces marincola]|uniref:N-acyl-D-glucosamine 2-epimerase n=1 Tax=Streptomyces marincola TaxID=2878388 RepID=A0A1W7D0S1_9ACTN|nr:AGE family epimerase/isomerase [Streptomyces marincola]ARQ70595.1 N-acyl-D-glucosamine 2-epimerase [Streptomyces marincola]
MPAEIDFTFSDLVGGYVESARGDVFVLRTFGGSRRTVRLTGTTTAQWLRNLGEPYRDETGRLRELLRPGVLVFSYGPVYPDSDGLRFQADRLVFVGDTDDLRRYETSGWWVDQLRELAAFYRTAQFGRGPVDFDRYRTVLSAGGGKPDEVQETDTISRMVYGMASAYLLTGDEDFLDVADRGSRYLHDHMRFTDEDVVYWYHGLERRADGERKLFASEFGDDYQAIPAYEQIYALVGLTQTYRVTGDPALLADIRGTLRLFERYFADRELGGWYSHIHPVSLSPHDQALGINRSRKNWNSIGDHAPAYLFNLYLATGEESHLRMLEHAFDMIVTRLPDRSPGGSPFVDERFHGDWTPDRAWGWQQDRAVVGHNLKIAWNLTRMAAVLPKPEYAALAARIARTMPDLGRDPQRGGWYDLVQRMPGPEGRHDFVWHDRKAWWQQEQAILAYLVLAGQTAGAGHAPESGPEGSYLRHAREAFAFYNAFFPDHDEGAVHFTVLAQGIPFLMGNERLKGSHAMAMYHKAELCYLAEVYGRLLIHGQPLTLWFAPGPDASYPGGLLRVAPDVLPRGRVELAEVRVDGAIWDDFDAEAMTVRLPRSEHRLSVRATLRPLPPGERG